MLVADDVILTEPDDAGDDELRVPEELLELHEVLEWNAAVAVAEEDPSS